MPQPAMIYVASSNAHLFLWALVGDGQLGSVALNGALGTPDGNGNFYWALGLAQPLQGRDLLVDATFLDVNPHSQTASITFILYQAFPDQADLPENRFNQRDFARTGLTFPAGAARAYSDIIAVQ